MELHEFFQAHPRVALAFSGGVDSAYLLYAARQAGAQVQPYFIQTPFQPRFERADAERLARQLGVELKVIPLDVLAAPEVAANGCGRCYYCKKALLGALITQAGRDGFPVCLDGTNASDVAEDRPGMRALAECGVLSPLRLCGLTKAEIRSRSRAAGLFTRAKPAYACLATRIPTGSPITRADLERVERAEDRVFALGFSDFRVRIFHDAARIQLPPEQMPLAVKRKDELLAALSPVFSEILLDLKGRG